MLREERMTRHLERGIEKLKKELLSISALVEEAVYKALRAVSERNPELAASVLAGDLEIDDREVEVEEQCLQVLALNQPVADDLRFIIAVLKMNNDLERIGDLAVNIAQRVNWLVKIKPPAPGLDFEVMAEKVKAMLHNSINALINLDLKLAGEIMASDDEIDRLNREKVSEVQSRIEKNPNHTETMLCLLGVGRALERIADHCTNIAEDVVYLVQGDIVRHKEGRSKKKGKGTQ